MARSHTPVLTPVLTLVATAALAAVIGLAAPFGALRADEGDAVSQPSAKAQDDEASPKEPVPPKVAAPDDERDTAQSGEQAGPKAPPEGKMTIGRMDEIVKRLDPKVVSARPGAWQFRVSNRVVIIITDTENNRMRILSPVAQVETLPEGALQRLLQANFDTALDARYAIARGVVWATFIHPLAALHDRQFISAIGQTVNLVETFGTTFSSGAMSFGGGDSRDIIRKRLIEKLMKKGLPI